MYIERKAHAAIGDFRDADSDRQPVAELRRRSKARLQRCPRHENLQVAEHRGSIASKAQKQLLFSVLEVAEEHAEPDDPGGIGVRPDYAYVDVMEQRHRLKIYHHKEHKGHEGHKG